MTPNQFAFAMAMHQVYLDLLRWEIARLEAKRGLREKML
jgi:hypothetical protein